MRTEFFEVLKAELELALPGKKAQLLMAPKGRQFPDAPNEAIHAAVALVIFNNTRSEKEMLLIKRPEYDGYHSGQVSFPGGKAESTDTDFFSTSLRECLEETGVLLDRQDLAGELSPLYIPVSKFMVYPFLYYLPQEPLFSPDPLEVQYLIRFPIKELFNPSIRKKKTIEILQQETVVPYYQIENEFVWGATAMILSELIAIFQAIEKKNPGII